MYSCASIVCNSFQIGLSCDHSTAMSNVLPFLVLIRGKGSPFCFISMRLFFSQTAWFMAASFSAITCTRVWSFPDIWPPCEGGPNAVCSILFAFVEFMLYSFKKNYRLYFGGSVFCVISFGGQSGEKIDLFILKKEQGLYYQYTDTLFFSLKGFENIFIHKWKHTLCKKNKT